MQKYLTVLLVFLGFAVIFCSGTAVALTPNDPYYSQQWALHIIKAQDGWNYETGSDDVVVAVIDTGADLSHPELVSRLWSGTAYDSASGRTITIHGYNTYDDNYNVIDTEELGDGHGTRSMGLVCSETDNGRGIAENI